MKNGQRSSPFCPSTIATETTSTLDPLKIDQTRTYGM